MQQFSPKQCCVHTLSGAGYEYIYTMTPNYTVQPISSPYTEYRQEYSKEA